EAPQILAPWMALMPTPPQPITSTDDPGATRAALIAAPTPVMTPQPTSEATSYGTSAAILIAPASGTISSSANVPAPAIPNIGSPPIVKWASMKASSMEVMHRCGLPLTQSAH